MNKDLSIVTWQYRTNGPCRNIYFGKAFLLCQIEVLLVFFNKSQTLKSCNPGILQHSVTFY